MSALLTIWPISSKRLHALSATPDMDAQAFMNNPLVQDAVIRHLEIIGEASHNIETRFPDFAASRPELPLAFACQMRNAVAHGYFKVDFEIVWNTIQQDLPRLHAQIRHAQSGDL